MPESQRAANWLYQAEVTTSLTHRRVVLAFAIGKPLRSPSLLHVGIVVVSSRQCNIA